MKIGLNFVSHDPSSMMKNTNLFFLELTAKLLHPERSQVYRDDVLHHVIYLSYLIFG